MNLARIFSGLALLLFPLWPSFAQQARDEPISENDRGRALEMVKEIRDTLKRNYYDTKFHGVDVDAKFKAAEERIRTATTFNQTLGLLPGRWIRWKTPTPISCRRRDPTGMTTASA